MTVWGWLLLIAGILAAFCAGIAFLLAQIATARHIGPSWLRIPTPWDAHRDEVRREVAWFEAQEPENATCCKGRSGSSDRVGNRRSSRAFFKAAGVIPSNSPAAGLAKRQIRSTISPCPLVSGSASRKDAAFLKRRGKFIQMFGHLHPSSH